MAHGLCRGRKLRRFIQIGTGMSCGRNAPRPVSEDYPGDDVEHYLDYTASKYEAEQRLRTELPELPLVVARPSIVVSHTELGCAASGSIYWVFRLARALQAFPANWIRRST
jgi:nucleoside-diphosphate-sugar epimerase